MSSLFAPLGTSPKIDPFAPLTKVPTKVPTPKRVLYISGKIELLSLPDGDRLWFGYRDSWYRRLDADAYLWLFSSFWKHYEANGLIEETMDLPDQFAFVKQQGVEFGAFTFNQVQERWKPPKLYFWREGFPQKVDRPYFGT
ncbi:MAG: hypothetical protein GY826_31305 [Fuerstiella sp.]|nr:hypothetical protein [Fuerstiella sp.]